MYDAIVIGARCGGAPTAMLLARKGYKVLLVDKAAFPKDIPHGHFIHRHGPARLHRWGLLERIVSSDCTPVTSVVSDLGDFPLVGNDLVSDGVAMGYAPRRFTLDKILVDAAVEAGAELRENFLVEGFLTAGDCITGIKGRDVHGSNCITESASITIGADGRNSQLAQFVGAPKYEASAAATFWYFSYWTGIPGTSLEVYVRKDKVIFAFPVNDQQYGIFIGWSRSTDFLKIRSDIEGNFMSVIEQIPNLADYTAKAKRIEPFYGATDLPNFFRKPYGPGWALVGDAGCHKDPFLALGICDAFRDAELLTNAISEGLGGSTPLAVALEQFEQQRNKATMADFQQNLALAQFKPPPADLLQLRQALRYNEEDTRNFFMANEGMIERTKFFNPENLQRIMATAKSQVSTN